MWRYSYEILGGILIFVSSLVTEQMPDKWKKPSWVFFGILAIVFVAVGIRLDSQTALTETALSGNMASIQNEVGTLQGDLDAVKRQNAAMLKFGQDNLTKQQAAELFQASAKAVLRPTSASPTVGSTEPSLSELSNDDLSSLPHDKAQRLDTLYDIYWWKADETLQSKYIDALGHNDLLGARRIQAERALLTSLFRDDVTDVLKEEEPIRIEALKRLQPAAEDVREGAILSAALSAKSEGTYPPKLPSYGQYLDGLAHRLIESRPPGK